ncbi:hypothetical protein USB125703_00836 [Pseudoclavibacter triregionum]|nr:hypothetical protein USB125703_00836 [Pseudoclavibacter triregionum]
MLSSRELPAPLAVGRSEGPGEPGGQGGATSVTKAQSLGSMSYMPPIIGQMLAGMVIQRLAGLAEMPPPPSLRGGADGGRPAGA